VPANAASPQARDGNDPTSYAEPSLHIQRGTKSAPLSHIPGFAIRQTIGAPTGSGNSAAVLDRAPLDESGDLIFNYDHFDFSRLGRRNLE